jgi:hypothetical protein
MKKAKFHYKAVAMAGHEVARCNLGIFEAKNGNMGQAVKHWMIGASAGCFLAMHNMLIALKKRDVSRETMDTTLTAYNNSCAEVKSKERDTCLQVMMERQLNEYIVVILLLHNTSLYFYIHPPARTLFFCLLDKW